MDEQLGRLRCRVAELSIRIGALCFFIVRAWGYGLGVSRMLTRLLRGLVAYT